MSVKNIKAIDIHSHISTGSKWDSPVEGTCYSTTQLENLKTINKAANIESMFVSTFSSVQSTEEIETQNEYLYQLSKEEDSLYQWVVIDPRKDETFEQAKRMLNTEKCVGIKLHPLMHQYDMEQYKEKLFDFASEHRANVLIHPEKPATEYILSIADAYPNVTFIMAHMGDETWVNAIEYAKYGNVYADTSGNASVRNMIIEYAVNRVGSEHILFGTDTYAAGFQRGRIEYALISDKDKKNILRYNAERLFKI